MVERQTENLKVESSILFVSIMLNGLLQVLKEILYWIVKKILVIFIVFCHHSHLRNPFPITKISSFELQLALRRIKDPSLRDDTNFLLYLLHSARKSYLYRLHLHNFIMQERKFERQHREREKKFFFKDRGYYFSLSFVIIIFLIFIALLSGIIA